MFSRLEMIFATTTILLLPLATSASSIFNSRQTSTEQTKPKAFKLSDIDSPTFKPQGFNGEWVSGFEFIYKGTSGDILVYDANRNVSKIAVSRSVLNKLGMVSFKISPNKKFVLFSYDVKKEFRHSVRAKYSIYDMETGAVIELGNKRDLQLAMWAPVGATLAYVLENNIYVTTPTSASYPCKITYDGLSGVVYYGVPDWVYEEEVLGSGTAIWFSPDGKLLAYAKFDDTSVDQVSYMKYSIDSATDSQYPTVANIRYPKPGRNNTIVSLLLKDLSQCTVGKKVLRAPFKSNEDFILTGVSWPRNDEVVAVWANRIQNQVKITNYNLTVPDHMEIEYVIEEINGWVQIPTPVFDETGKKFVTVIPWSQGNVNKYMHLALFSRKIHVGSNTKQILTSGPWDVTKVYGWDKQKKIYFQGTLPDNPSSRHVYSINYDGTGKSCLSCNVMMENTSCLFANADFSHNFTYHALTCMGPGVPYVAIYRGQTFVSMWNTNEVVKNALKERILPEVCDTRVNIKEKYTAHVRLWLPPKMDKSGNTKYPMVVNVYAGPGSQLIDDNFRLGWGAYLTTNKTYIYAFIDGRGSAHKGSEMLFSVYENLGKYEVEDQIEVTRKLQETYPYIDKDRCGIWGWSYGGYATAMALATDTDGVFKCGISVAPVTNWLYYGVLEHWLGHEPDCVMFQCPLTSTELVFAPGVLYDSIYTERYMGLLDFNKKAYENADVTRKISNFRNKQFLLMHGTADDNVHYQNAMMLSRALELEDILFSQQTYPDEAHGISSLLKHVYHSQDEFWNRCFQKDIVEKSASRSVFSSASALLLILPALILVLD